MSSVALYNRARRACHVEGMSKSEAGRLFGIDRQTVSKILEHAVPPGYRRMSPPARPKLDPFIPIIDQILEDDKSQLKKQRHTARRIFERLRDGEPCRAIGPSDNGERVHRRHHHRYRLCP
jgi:transposase